MLITNAENLMRSVSGTLRAAESASVKVFLVHSNTHLENIYLNSISKCFILICECDVEIFILDEK